MVILKYSETSKGFNGKNANNEKKIPNTCSALPPTIHRNLANYLI